MIKESKIEETSEIVINFKKYGYASLTESDSEILFKEELQVIDDVIDRISHFSSKEVINYSRGDLAWKIAKDGGQLNYEAVFYRDPQYSREIR